MTSSIATIIQNLQDSEKARIKLTVKGGNQIHLGCVYKQDNAPYFYLVFPPHLLPDTIDTNKNHPVSIHHQEGSVSLNTTIIEKKGDRTIYLRAESPLDPASLREYFRVNTTTEISASFESSHKGKTSVRWAIDGKTQDLSGSGVLAQFPDEPQNRENLLLEIFLPDKKYNIMATAHVVRKKLLRNKHWQVAFHFDTISNKHRDAIITYLLSEQRKQLRERVHAWD